MASGVEAARAGWPVIFNKDSRRKRSVWRPLGRPNYRGFGLWVGEVIHRLGRAWTYRFMKVHKVQTGIVVICQHITLLKDTDYGIKDTD